MTMATVIMQRWDGFTPDQYEALRDIVRWDQDKPAGMQVHVANFLDGTMRLLDVWDTEDEFDEFVAARIVPGLEKLGIPGLPEKIVAPLHELTCGH
jgi:hypothetical protein